jgi:valyl-tRNA synthetase
MSKSLGNSPDPIELMKKYSADGVRVGMLLCSPAGNDLLFDESLTEQGRNFSNKIWNAFRLIQGWSVDARLLPSDHAIAAVDWFEASLNRTIKKVDEQFAKYRISDALMLIYRLFWDEFSSWYLEIIKPSFESPIDKRTYDRTIGFIDHLLHLLHPFMPFITEEIWQLIIERKKGESLMISSMPAAQKYDKALLKRFEGVKEVVTQIRSIRKEKNIPPREPVTLMFRSTVNGKHHDELEPVMIKLANLSGVVRIEENPEGSISFIVNNVEYFIPVDGVMDREGEIVRLESELEYTRGFLLSVKKKLENERFVQHAPATVVEKERQKLADADAKIGVLKAQIEKLRS